MTPLTKLASAQAKTAYIFSKAIAHSERMDIVNFILANQNCMVRDIHDNLPVPQGLVSKHIMMLKKAGIVSTQVNPRNAKSNLCTVDTEYLTQGIEAIEFFVPYKG